MDPGALCLNRLIPLLLREVGPRAEKLTRRWVSGECERTEFISLRVQAELIPELAALVFRGTED